MIPHIWQGLPGTYFCISTKSPEGKWKDHFFDRDSFDQIPRFVREHKEDNVYFCPHGFNKRRRLEEHAVPPPMCWADLDGVDPRQLDIKPSIAIESSPNRYAGLWFTDKPITKELNQRLTYAIGADKGGWDLTQVLRLPGTYNHKYDAHPRVKLLWDDGPTHKLLQLEKSLPQIANQHSVELSDASSIYSTYKSRIPPWARRELLRKDEPEPGKRSEVLWKLQNTLIEAGMDTPEILTVIKASVWNKFKGRSNEDTQLLREIEKIVAERLSGKSVDLSDPDEDPKFLIKSMADVEEEELDWLWYPYLARGELSILEGDPGLGKSYLAQILSGALVDGRSLPSNKPRGQKPIQGKIAYFDIENSAGTVTKRRLVDNGVVNLRDYYQEETPFSIDDEDAIESIYEAMERIRPVMVTFDTLNSYMGKADTYKASEVQQTFAHFRGIAKDFNCAVLVLRHLTKGSKEKALYRGQGSIAFAGLARVVMTVGVDPEDPDTRVMAVTKINVTRAPRALTFRINEMPNDRSKFTWGEYTDLTPDEILSSPPKENKEQQASILQAAKDFLKEILEDEPEGLPFDRICRAAESRAITKNKLLEAKEALGIREKNKGVGRRLELRWILPK